MLAFESFLNIVDIQGHGLNEEVHSVLLLACWCIFLGDKVGLFVEERHS